MPRVEPWDQAGAWTTRSGALTQGINNYHSRRPPRGHDGRQAGSAEADGTSRDEVDRNQPNKRRVADVGIRRGRHADADG